MIPVLESQGLIFDLDMEMLRRACAFYREQNEKGTPLHTFSVNLSRYDFKREELFSKVIQTLEEHDVPREAIKLEITENTTREWNNHIMKDYIIATSSTCDLPREWLEEHRIPFIRYGYSVNGEPYEDDCRDAVREAMFKAMRQGDNLKTSMINENAYYEFFRGLLETGKDVLFLDMAEKMSASYQNAKRAAAQVSEEYPGQRLCVLDTRCISGGLGLLTMEAVKRKEAGDGFDEVIQWCEANKLRIAHRFTVDDLNYLKRSGRVSNASALIGSILNIKPVLYVPDEGTLNAVTKARGRRAALKAIRDSILNDLSGIDASDRQMLILHADCLEDAQWLQAQIRTAHPELPRIDIGYLGIVISAHVGPGLLTAFYLCNGRKPM